MRVGLIGVGKLGSCIARALSQTPSCEPVFYEESEERKAFLRESLKTESQESLEALVSSSEIIILCVKPNQLKELLKSLSSLVSSKHLLVSTCAGVRIQEMESELGVAEARFVRSMPNIAVSTGKGITAISKTSVLTGAEKVHLEKLFGAMGSFVFISEELFDVFTAVCASGPAFVFDVLRSFESYAKREGFSEENSSLMARQLAQGVAALLENSSQSLESWIKQVATPGGCTAAGLEEAKKQKLEASLHQVLESTAERSSELSLRDH